MSDHVTEHWKQILASVLIGAIIGALAAIFLGCGVARSPLLKDPTYPKHCKMELECGYLNQDNPTAKGQCTATHGPKCGKALDYEFCDSREEKPPEGMSSAELKLFLQTQKHKIQVCMARLQ